MPEPNLCRHCFSVLEEGETVCSACGQKPEAPNPDAALRAVPRGDGAAPQ